MYAASIDQPQPPFDNVLVRRAAQRCLGREQVPAAAGFGGGLGRPDCAAQFMCGPPFESTAGLGAIQRPSMDRARPLSREAGSTKERLVLMHPLDSQLLNPFGIVPVDRMKQAGFNLGVQGGAWSSLAQRWVQRQPLGNIGWSVIPVIRSIERGAR